MRFDPINHPEGDQPAMPHRFGVGIIGLGRGWRRYGPALAALHDRLSVRAVCDQRPDRAERAARQLGCVAAAGPTELLDRDDVTAVLLLGAQWFGLWPLEQAARRGKPVFCAVSPATDDAHADDVLRQVRAVGLPVMAALAPALTPAVTRLRELLQSRLGPPRLVRCEWCGSGRTNAAGLPGERVLPGLMHACAGLLGDDPVSAWTTTATAAGLTGVLLEFAGGRAAQLSLWTGPRRTCRIQAVTDAGDATAEWPRLLHWRDGDGSHTVRAPRRPMPRLLLEGFVDALAAGATPQPSFADAHRALVWMRAARRSLTEGRRVELAADHEPLRDGA